MTLGAQITRSNGTWLSRYVDTRPISNNGAFRIVGCRKLHSGRRTVVVIPDPKTNRRAAEVALRRLYQAHRSATHLALAPAAELHDSREQLHVTFDIPAQFDLHTLVGLVGHESTTRFAHAQGDAFTHTLRKALTQAAEHSTEADAPLCIGVLSYNNILFAPDGRFWLLGLGHNVACCDEHGNVTARVPFAASEVLLGERATRMGDYVALMHLARSLLRFLNVEPRLQTLLKGAGSSTNSELHSLLDWIHSNVMGLTPERRPTLDEAVEVAWKIRRIIGSKPDLEGFRSKIADIVRRTNNEFSSDDEWHSWRVAHDASRIVRGTKEILLGNGPMQRIFNRLLVAHEQQPGVRMGVQELFQAGWPGERIRKRSGANRVYVTISGLRRRGLGDDLESDGGYRLSPTIEWVREPSTSAEHR